MQTTRPLYELDLETYPKYFLCKLYNEERKEFYSFGMWEGHPLDIPAIVDILARVTIVTFNGVGYDIPMLTLALYGATNEQLKQANDDIIVRKVKPWTFGNDIGFYDRWGIQQLDYIDNIDVMEVAPGVRISLKMYMGRLHAPTIQDLPYDPSTNLDGAGRFVVSEYCGNDLIGTNLLRHEVWDRIMLRQAIGERYGIDVRSKSDAQVAEKVFKAQLDFRPVTRYIPHGFTFKYEPPAYIQFISPQMQELLQVIRTADFVVTDKEESIALYGEENAFKTGVQIPRALKGRDIIIGNGVYRLGIGGLHSQEKSVSYYTIPGVQKLKDIDVKSYYPSLILQMGMVPEQLGPAFRIIYQAIYERRLLSKSEAQRIANLWENMGSPELKEEADRLRTESDGLKIVLNGVFGKLFSKYSIFYAPELGIRTTITGQLALLMLIEMMEYSGIAVVSANTDGIVLLIPEGLEPLAAQIVAWWEKRTGLEMEETLYKSIHQRDVNNYIAIDVKGKAKRKGVFNQGGVLSGPQGKGPNMDIAADAVVAWLKDGKPIHETIYECKDIRKFIVLRGVSGGGSYVPGRAKMMDALLSTKPSDLYLGKAVRWYYGNDRSAYIADAKGGRVATSAGAVPVLKLPETFPTDIEYGKYINEAMEMVGDIGIPVRHWYHPESDAYFTAFADEEYAEQNCDELTQKQYDKRK